MSKISKANFAQQLEQLKQIDFNQQIANITALEVKAALNKTKLDLTDFVALISPAAEPFIEQLAIKSQQLTQQRFGKTIQLFVPLYLSNQCSNICTYCGFSMEHNIRRKTLSIEEVHRECQAIKQLNFDHILLVTGESERKVGMDYFKQIIPIVKQYFEHITLEIQPLEENQYKELKVLGVSSVLVYQETYDKAEYAKHHLKGKKSDFAFRLATPERIAQAGIDKIGLGSLLGLFDWRLDAIMLAAHLAFMEKHYWQSRYSISLPRLRPCQGNPSFSNNFLTDKQLLQLICAFRLFSPTVELSLSTRETAYFRDNAFVLGITSMSAGSVTQPGGYAENNKALEQFEIDDSRSPNIVANAIKQRGYQVIWKDWSQSFSG